MQEFNHYNLEKRKESFRRLTPKTNSQLLIKKLWKNSISGEKCVCVRRKGWSTEINFATRNCDRNFEAGVRTLKQKFLQKDQMKPVKSDVWQSRRLADVSSSRPILCLLLKGDLLAAKFVETIQATDPASPKKKKQNEAENKIVLLSLLKTISLDPGGMCNT